MIPLARQYWRCRRGTIFCGGRYMIRARLCVRCYGARRERKRGRIPKDSVSRRPRVWYINRVPGSRSHGPRWGAALDMIFSGRLFADGKRRRMTYARWLYERVAGPLPDDLVVVALCGGLPQFEDLIVVRRDETRNGVARYLHELDVRGGQETPF